MRAAVKESNRELMYAAMQPLIQDVVDISLVEAKALPISMVGEFFTPQVYARWAQQYRAGFKKFLKLATDGELASAPAVSLAIKNILTFHGNSEKIGLPGKEGRVLPWVKTFSYLQASLINPRVFVGIEADNAIAWRTMIAPQDDNFKNMPFSESKQAALIDFYHANIRSHSRDRTVCFPGMHIRGIQRAMEYYWESLVFMLMHATGAIQQQQEFDIPKKQVADFVKFAQPVVTLCKLGAKYHD